MSTQEVSSFEKELARFCPGDTNGDGNCGQLLCPWCGVAFNVRNRRYVMVLGLIERLARDVWDDETITKHAREAAQTAYNYQTGMAVRKEDWPVHEGYLSAMTLVAIIFGADVEMLTPEVGYEPGLAGVETFLDDLHYNSGLTHERLLLTLRPSARQLDPYWDEHHPGGRANIRPRPTHVAVIGLQTHEGGGPIGCQVCIGLVSGDVVPS